MNVLIVDDDRFVVSALETRIDWPSLSINKVWTASNIRQAQAILEQQPVHVLICDIEMPQGSGLELLAWIRETGRDIPTIFLTNYALFHYAQKAIELQSLDYFLKPISYEKFIPVLQKAIDQAASLLADSSNEAADKAQFWHSLLFDGTSCEKLPSLPPQWKYGQDDGFLFVWIEWFRPVANRAARIRVVQNDPVYETLLSSLQSMGLSLETTNNNRDRTTRTLVLRASFPLHDKEPLTKALLRFISDVRAKTGLDCCVAISGDFIPLQKALATYNHLIEMMQETVLCRGKLLSLSNYLPWDGIYDAPDMLLLESSLRALYIEGFLFEVTRYLQSQYDSLCAKMLNIFYIDIFQIFLALLREKNIEAHMLFSGEIHAELTRHRLDSLEDFTAHIEYLATAVIGQIQLSVEPESIVRTLVQYIEKHIDKVLTRQILSEQVFLNPDYLARIFKREMGISLGQYIKAKRIELAKKLLLETNLSMRDIAIQTGYGNYSYFTNAFHRATDMMPQEYRFLCSK